jgi:oligopeptidase B
MNATIFKLFLGLSFLFLVACNTNSNNKNTNKMDIKAPIAEKIPFELKIHGETRIDNYYWMRLSDEQKSAAKKDAQTQKVYDYLNAENDYCNALMKHTKAFQESLYKEMVGRIKQDDASVPYFKNGYWYYTRYAEGKEYAIYCRKKGSLDSKEEIMLDGNTLAKGLAYFDLGAMSVSPDNKILAYATDVLSRRVYTVYFKNLETGELYKDLIKGTSGSMAWADDNKTLFYCKSNEKTLLSEKIYRHKIGSEQNADVMVYHEKDPSYYIGVYRSKSDKFIIIYNSSTLSSDYHLLESNKPEGQFRQFAKREADHEYDIMHFENKFYIRSNWNAQNFRLMEVAEGKTADKNAWKEVIAHRSDVFIESADVFKKYLVVEERSMGTVNLRIRNQSDGKEHYVEFKEEAYTVGIGTNTDINSEQLRFEYSSLTTPNSTYDYNMATKERSLKKRQEVVGGHNPDDYETKRLYANGRDGKKIPISIVYKKGFNKNGKAPLLLYAYGSYGTTIDPYFSSTRLSLLDRGFAFAIAHIRGGQFLGRAWYEDGKMQKKLNSFYDFIDCAKYLLEEKYSNKEALFAMGGSAGGLLMGGVANMAPELFKGIVAQVPFVDVITTMSDPTIPLTTNEYDEWGNPENKEAYEYMKRYSPYDNVEKKAYTNMLVTTGLFDSQVQYWEPAKWVAKLRDYKTDKNLLLFKTNMDAGHGGSSGRFQRYKEVALEYAFMFDLVGVKK